MDPPGEKGIIGRAPGFLEQTHNAVRRLSGVLIYVLLSLLSAAMFAFPAFGLTSRYAGSEVCAKCHKEISASQGTTAMAKTWDAAATAPLPAGVMQEKREGPDPALLYKLQRSGAGLRLSLSGKDWGSTLLPVEVTIGGSRHGISFLTRILELDGIPLARAVLLEARYAARADGSFVLSPGFPVEKPASLESALGRALSPGFEKKCLTCHGKPGTGGAGKSGGIHCESCHGPAAEHAESFSAGGRQPVHLLSLAGSKSMETCAGCHTGLNNVNHADPVPGDLLVSSQVPALQHSECYRQSGGQITCIGCHDPHRDTSAASLNERSIHTCLRCHSEKAGPRHAALCPVNGSSGCIGCHMPGAQLNSFKVADHWIAVHPEQAIKADRVQTTVPSLTPPLREYLQMITTEDRAKAEAALQRVTDGEAFYDVARQTSIDPAARAGGYVGDLQLSEMDARLAEAAAHLWYGQTSGIIEQGSRHVILHRLPRDFRWQANQLFLEAVRLQSLGDRKSAAVKAHAALKLYPYFLRAHIFMGTQIGEMGDEVRASSVLGFAAQSYRDDGFAQFRYALSLSKQPGSQIEALRRTIKLEPDMIAAYERLAAALAASGDMKAAVEVVRQGLSINPVSAALNSKLGLALQNDEPAKARQFLGLAKKLNSGP